MARPRYEETECKSVLNRVRGMGFGWSINPYKGCVHGCHYCFARRFHSFIDLNAGDDFSGIILVRVNAPEVLRGELARRSWKRETVVLGTATDPYQPIEGKYRLTRGVLEALRDYRTPVSVITKGSMIVRDIDVLAELASKAGCTVGFSITTLDEATWRRLEPGTPPPWQRLRAMQRLVEAGVNAGVNLAPVVPGLTDDLDNLHAVVRAASAHHASFVNAMPLRLQMGVKEHFLSFLDREYPHLLPRYETLYPGQYPPKRYGHRVQRSVDVYRERFHLTDRETHLQESTTRGPRQLALRM